MKKLNLNENFISRIWRDKMHYKDLKTTDGKSVEVLDYGIINKDSGADYKNAKVSIDNNIFSGDIEIHRSFKDWEQHAHKSDGKYNKVILQVVFWDEDFPEDVNLPKVMKSREIPTIVLSSYLTKSIHEIWKEIINNPSSEFKLPCYPANEKVDIELKNDWITNVSLKRISYRAGRLKQRLEKLEETEFAENKKQIWEKLFFEYMLEALGFSKNKEQFLKFAGNIDLNKIKKSNFTQIEIESFFFGTAGLLSNLKYRDEYIKQLKEKWEILKTKYKPVIMNKAEWNFFRLRPQNFPTIRMAYAASFCLELLSNNFFKKVILCFEKSINAGKDLANLFLDILLSGYWKNHYIFGKKINGNIKSIGQERVKEIITNVVLPLLYFYAEQFEKSNLKEKVTKYYFSAKDRSENEVTKVMQQQLNIKSKTISDSQGLIHLHNFYCVKGKCDECIIGKQIFNKDSVADVLKIILY
ncbi:MAG: DUF2851 family protein [Ignavibacteriae bacterium]|nr:DUF2851 family protein [Ignavibacteriota bacterium]